MANDVKVWRIGYDAWGPHTNDKIGRCVYIVQDNGKYAKNDHVQLQSDEFFFGEEKRIMELYRDVDGLDKNYVIIRLSEL